jgi:hypothetical protein
MRRRDAPREAGARETCPLVVGVPSRDAADFPALGSLGSTFREAAMRIGFLTRRASPPRSCLAALLLCVVLPSAFAADTSPLVKLALFDFELEDQSAGASLTEVSQADTDLLKQVTNDARKLLAESSRFSLVDTGSADDEAARGRGLHSCNGCDAGIAAKLGADQSFIGIVTRVSRTEYMIRIQITDARTGAVISNNQSGLRMGADYSWGRGVASLIKSNLLKSED